MVVLGSLPYRGHRVMVGLGSSYSSGTLGDVGLKTFPHWED